jgi:lysophospholipase L1-like esterase
MMNRFLQSLPFVVLLSSLHASGSFWDEIPPSPSTTLPAVVLDDYWNGEFQRVNREIKDAPDPGLVFFGDSITWSWSLGPATGREIWDKQFAAYKPINMGNSGDITPVMLHRVTRGNLDFPAGKHPKVAVLLCGINNFGVNKSAGGKEKWDLGMHCPPEDIAHGQRAIAQVFRRKLPYTRVIMMALLPVADAAKWEKCQRVNEIQERFTRNDDEVIFLNLQDSFLNPDRTFNKELYKDGIHPNAKGYQVWADGIGPRIEELMKAPPLAPVKIMLIGGSITEGADSKTSYRRYLDGMLRRKEHRIDFIGSRHKHGDDRTLPESYEFDPDHEGHWGKDSAWLARNIPRLLVQNVPDIAVIQPDGSEMVSKNTEPGILADGIARNISGMIAALRSKNPNVRIVVAPPLPGEGAEQVATLLAQKLSGLARPAAPDQPPLFLVDLGRGLDRTEDLGPENSLPTASGARKLAASIAEALEPALSGFAPSSPPP